MRSVIQLLQQLVILQDGEIEPEDQRALQMVWAVHRASGRTKLLTVDAHAAIDGCSGPAVYEVMNKANQCSEFLHPASVMTMQAGASNAEPCAKSRWRAPGERLHDVLFGLPHAIELNDQVTAWVSVCLQVWLNKASAQFADVASCPEDECSTSCTLRAT